MIQCNLGISLLRAWATVIVLIAASLASAQATYTPPVETKDSSVVSAPLEEGQQHAAPARTQSGTGRNFKDWTRQGGPIMFAIYLDFVLGLGVIVSQLVRVQFDKYRARPVLKALRRKLAEQTGGRSQMASVHQIFEIVSQHANSLLARLFVNLCGLWQRDPKAETLQAEIKHGIDSARKSYDLSRSFAVLLSDTAGALGLLGTVLGMYQTFLPGKLEATRVIVGMGVALVTTIGGLIVSIALNFAISFAQSRYTMHLAAVNQLADQFRYLFGKGQSLGAVSTGHSIAQSGETQAMPDSVPETNMAPPQRIPSRIRILGGDHQIAAAGEPLPEALEVEVDDQNGRPMENLPVIFDTNGTQIVFDNGVNLKRVETDGIGRVRVRARLGKLVGQHTITAKINGEVNLIDEFHVECRPGAPDKLHVLSGHLQTSTLGTLLSEPLSLKLEDASGNPVPDQPVIFEVTYNSGHFDHDKSRVEVRTDDEGIARVEFRMGETPGANIVKAWVKGKSSRKLEASFESMGVS